MGFLDNIFKAEKGKKLGGNKSGGGGNTGNNKGLGNPFANFGGPRTFHGQGQSLGGSKPGKVISVSLSNPGPLGVRVEKRPNSGGTAIVNEVVAGTQAEAAGLKRGDILCFAGSNGQEEIMYDMFLELAKSPERPIELEVRRIETKAEIAKQAKSADADHRRQAVIAAAEAREKKHKAKTKPVQRITKSTLTKQQGDETVTDVNANISNEPLSAEAARAAALAKQGEQQLAAQLGYNPYETARANAGQAWTATTAAQHGTIQAESASDHLPSVAPPRDAALPVSEPQLKIDFPPDFEEAYATFATGSDKSAAQASANIMKKLIVNATTKGQASSDESSAKFRKVRLANAKIKAAIVDVPGAIDIMLTVGFTLQEQGDESVLIFPADYPGPDWLSAALKQLESFA